MISFTVKEHSLLLNTMVEVWRDGEFVAGIYGAMDGVRVVSKYLDGVREDANKPDFPPSVTVKLKETV